MALLDMMTELHGAVPKFPMAYTKTTINRAWSTVRQSHLWSFNIIEWSWISPPPVSAGTATFTQGSATISFDATAVAALNASFLTNTYSPITTRQFRTGNVAGLSGIYNIIQYDPVGGGATLDRIFADPGGVATAYNVYQVYYVAPVKDFETPKSVRNMQMFLDLNLDSTRAEIDTRDPQRSWYQFPTHVVPFGTDQRGFGTVNASATLGYPMYELWGQPVNPFTYQCYGLRKGLDLVNPTDTLPFRVGDNLGEDLVIAMAKRYAYEWAEANRDISPRSTGPDFKFLMGAAEKLYRDLLREYRRLDKEIIDNYYSVRMPDAAAKAFGYYNTIGSVAGPYPQP